MRTKTLYVLRFSPDVTTSDVEKFLKELLQLNSLTCSMLETKFRSHTSVHIPISEGDFHLMKNTGVSPNGCTIIPYYGLLNSDQIYSADKSDIFRPPEPGAGSHPPVPLLDHTGGLGSTDRAQGDGTAALSRCS